MRIFQEALLHNQEYLTEEAEILILHKFDDVFDAYVQISNTYLIENSKLRTEV